MGCIALVDSVHRIFWILKSEILMLKYRETVCCRECLLLCSSVVFGFRNGTDAVVDFSFMGIVFVKGLCWAVSGVWCIGIGSCSVFFDMMCVKNVSRQ